MSGGHICHIGFWSGGSVLGDLSMGLWGVWETVTGLPHFELRKGGVFRMIPTHIVDRIDKEISPWDMKGF